MPDPDELLATRRLSASEAIRELRRQYQTAGALSSLPDEARLDRTRETERALAAFSAGTCLLFVDGEQVRDLDRRNPLGPPTSFELKTRSERRPGRRFGPWGAQGGTQLPKALTAARLVLSGELRTLPFLQRLAASEKRDPS